MQSMSAEIRINVVIKATPEKVYNSVTTQEGLQGWWCKQTTAKPEQGFVNVFTFGKIRNEMKITRLTPNKRVEWKCINSTEEWIGTEFFFDIEEKDGKTILRFSQAGWRSMTDTFAGSTYDWAIFLKSLKSFCE